MSKTLRAFPKGELIYAASATLLEPEIFGQRGKSARDFGLLHRGDLRTPGDLMKPGAPPLWGGVRDEFSLPESADEAAARAELARYLVREDNPLVWRSIANRLWQWTMGAPLVATPNDFGRGGGQPTHPELLDYLAARLRDDPGQSMKLIVKLLVNSETYRRASTQDPDNARIDGGTTTCGVPIGGA